MGRCWSKDVKCVEHLIYCAILSHWSCSFTHLWWRPILEMLGMEPHFCSVAGGYALTVLLVTPFMGLQRSIGTWLVAQSLGKPRLEALVVTSAERDPLDGWWVASANGRADEVVDVASPAYDGIFYGVDMAESSSRTNASFMRTF